MATLTTSLVVNKLGLDIFKVSSRLMLVLILLPQFIVKTELRINRTRLLFKLRVIRNHVKTILE